MFCNKEIHNTDNTYLKDIIDRESVYSKLDKLIYEIKNGINSNMIVIDSIMGER